MPWSSARISILVKRISDNKIWIVYDTIFICIWTLPVTPEIIAEIITRGTIRTITCLRNIDVVLINEIIVHYFGIISPIEIEVVSAAVNNDIIRYQTVICTNPETVFFTIINIIPFYCCISTPDIYSITISTVNHRIINYIILISNNRY